MGLEVVGAVEGPYVGRSVPNPEFAGDDGTAPPALAEALASGEPAGVVAALLSTRVLVPVVAVLGDIEVGSDGLARDKSSDMAVVTVRAPSGRLALPVFSSIAAMAAWNPDARPVPVAGVLAARAAYDEGADTVLVDPAGPARVVLGGALLRALAGGRPPVAAIDDEDLRTAIDKATEDVGLRTQQVVLDAGDEVDVVVRLIIDVGVSDAAGAEAAHALGAALAADPVVSDRLVRGLDLSVERAEVGNSDTP